MPDYQEMYLHLMRETEEAIHILVKAQQDCEELYLRESSPALRILPAQNSSELAGTQTEHPKKSASVE